MHKSASLPHHTKYHATHSILQLFSANGEGRKGSLLVCEGLSAAAHSATTCSVPEKAGELFLAARRVRDLLSLSLQVCNGVSLRVSEQREWVCANVPWEAGVCIASTGKTKTTKNQKNSLD